VATGTDLISGNQIRQTCYLETLSHQEFSVRNFYIICLIPLGLAACSQKPLLTTEQKARYTVELLAARSECKVFEQRLLPPVTDQNLIDQTYQAAKAAHCLKPSV
jgi:hypothetical protein